MFQFSTCISYYSSYCISGTPRKNDWIMRYTVLMLQQFANSTFIIRGFHALYLFYYYFDCN